MNIEILKQELKKIHTNLFGNTQKNFVNHNCEKMFISNVNGKWNVFINKYIKGALLNEMIDLKEHTSESEACTDFLQREKEYQNRKINEYEDKFSDTPIELAVVTGSLGFGGYGFVNGYWIYNMEIIAWCENDNVVKQGKAKLERRMTREEETRFTNNIVVDNIYKVKVRAQKENINDTIYFYLDEVLEKTTHTELQKILDKTLTPISIQDECLGDIVWDRKTKSFDVVFKLWNGNATLSVNLDDIELLKKHLPIIKKHITWIQNNKEKIFNEIVTDTMIDNANEWRPCSNDGTSYYEIDNEKFETEITKEIFIGAIDKCECNMGLNVNNDKYSYSIYFDTRQPDLFAGHCIEMYINVVDDNYEFDIRGIVG